MYLLSTREVGSVRKSESVKFNVKPEVESPYLLGQV